MKHRGGFSKLTLEKKDKLSIVTGSAVAGQLLL